VEKPELLRKLEGMLDEAARTRMYGNIEIEIREGTPVVIRKSTTELLQREKTQHGYNHR